LLPVLTQPAAASFLRLSIEAGERLDSSARPQILISWRQDGLLVECGVYLSIL
jgi:hypothetical protein